MIEFINKYKQAFTVVGAISVLTVCYFQQKELAKLRVNNFENQQKIDSLTFTLKQTDSLLSKYKWASNLYFYDIKDDTAGGKKFQSLVDEDYRQLEISGTGAN